MATIKQNEAKLKETLKEYQKNHLRLVQPTIIIMHPNTWSRLSVELYGLIAKIYKPRLKLDGVEIIRSADIKEGDFKIF